jgi:hypothetical protein
MFLQDDLKLAVGRADLDSESEVVNLDRLAACPILNYSSHEGEKRRMAKVAAALKVPTTKQRCE